MSSRQAKSNLSEFEEMLVESSLSPHLCILFTVSWVAGIDGQTHHDEEAVIRGAFAQRFDAESISSALRLSVEPALSDVQTSLRVLSLLANDMKHAVLRLAVGVSLADGYLRATENHALRLIADAIGLGPSALNSIFFEFTRASFPKPGDPSSKAWWTSRSKAARPPRSQREVDLQTLGLPTDADPQLIRTAYLRLAKAHHPDRYAAAGEEAMRIAEAHFKKVHAAYSRLSSS